MNSLLHLYLLLNFINDLMADLSIRSLIFWGLRGAQFQRSVLLVTDFLLLVHCLFLWPYYGAFLNTREPLTQAVSVHMLHKCHV